MIFLAFCSGFHVLQSKYKFAWCCGNNLFLNTFFNILISEVQIRLYKHML